MTVRFNTHRRRLVIAVAIIASVLLPSLWIIRTLVQKEAVRDILARSPEVLIQYNVMFDGTNFVQRRPMIPSYLMDYLGEDCFYNVNSIETGKGAIASDELLADVVKLVHLQRLHIESAFALTDSGVAELAGLHHLSTLVLYDSRLTDKSLTTFSRLSLLDALCIQSDRITNRGMLELRSLGRLKRLHLLDAKIDDEGIAVISTMDSLEAILLARTQITDAGVKYLAQLPRLKELKIFDTDITDDSVPAIARLVHLKSLQLEGTNIRPSKLIELKSLPMLQELYLSSDKHEDVTELRQALPRCKVHIHSSAPQKSGPSDMRESVDPIVRTGFTLLRGDVVHWLNA